MMIVVSGIYTYKSLTTGIEVNIKYIEPKKF